jgi:hypothetical protein
MAARDCRPRHPLDRRAFVDIRPIPTAADRDAGEQRLGPVRPRSHLQARTLHDDALGQLELVFVAEAVARIDQRHSRTLLSHGHGREAFRGALNSANQCVAVDGRIDGAASVWGSSGIQRTCRPGPDHLGSAEQRAAGSYGRLAS